MCEMVSERVFTLMGEAYDSMIEIAETERKKKILRACKAAHFVADKALIAISEIERIPYSFFDDKALDDYEQFFKCLGKIIDRFTTNCNLIKGGMEYAATASETPQDDGSVGR